MIKLNNVNFKYNNYVDVLKNINLEVSSGEIVLIKGTSGVGKTTLLKILSNSYSPSSGEYTNTFKNICFSRTDGYLVDEYTVMDNLLMVGANKSILYNKSRKYLQVFGLEWMTNRKVGTLSTGERRRLLLIQYLVSDSELLILDEPTANLDEENIGLIIEIIEQLVKNDGVTIIIASHDQRLDAISNKIFDLNKNECVVNKECDCSDNMLYSRSRLKRVKLFDYVSWKEKAGLIRSHLLLTIIISFIITLVLCFDYFSNYLASTFSKEINYDQVYIYKEGADKKNMNILEQDNLMEIFGSFSELRLVPEYSTSSFEIDNKLYSNTKNEYVKNILIYPNDYLNSNYNVDLEGCSFLISNDIYTNYFSNYLTPGSKVIFNIEIPDGYVKIDDAHVFTTSQKKISSDYFGVFTNDDFNKNTIIMNSNCIEEYSDSDLPKISYNIIIDSSETNNLIQMLEREELNYFINKHKNVSYYVLTNKIVMFIIGLFTLSLLLILEINNVVFRFNLIKRGNKLQRLLTLGFSDNTLASGIIKEQIILITFSIILSLLPIFFMRDIISISSEYINFYYVIFITLFIILIVYQYVTFRNIRSYIKKLKDEL